MHELKGRLTHTTNLLKMCPEIVARSPGCKERGEPKTGAYLGVCEDFRRDPRRRRLGPQ
jgi:hypothetical protein